MSRAWCGAAVGLAAVWSGSESVAQPTAPPAQRGAERVTVVRRVTAGDRQPGFRHAVMLPQSDDDEVLTPDREPESAPTTDRAAREDPAQRAARELGRLDEPDAAEEGLWQRARPYGPYWVDSAWVAGYWSGRLDERRYQSRRFNLRDMQARRERLYSAHDAAMASGLSMLRSGEYSRAVIALTMASRLDQSDPAARVHLAQARMGLGQYAEAGKALRRAYELQPKLVYVDLRLASNLPDERDFARQVEALAGWVGENGDADAAFLLGAMEFQRGNYEAAWRAFRRVRPRDDATRAFMEVTRPTVKASEGRAAMTAQSP